MLLVQEALTLFVCFSVCMCLVVMIPLQDVTKTIGHYVSAGIVIFFTLTILCLYALRLDSFCDSILDILDRSLSFPQIGIGAECIGTIFSLSEIFP